MSYFFIQNENANSFCTASLINLCLFSNKYINIFDLIPSPSTFYFPDTMFLSPEDKARAREQPLPPLLCCSSKLLLFIMEWFASSCASGEQTRLTEQELRRGAAGCLHNFPLPERLSEQRGAYSTAKQTVSGAAQAFQLNHL